MLSAQFRNNPLFIRACKDASELKESIEHVALCITRVAKKLSPFDCDNRFAIYWIIDQYLQHAITDNSFCSMYYHHYYLDRHYELSEHEDEILSELGHLTLYYSEYEEDIKAYPSIYYGKEKLYATAVAAKNARIDRWSKGSLFMK